MKSVLIADNHPLFRAGVRQLIQDSDGFQLIGEAGDCDSCLFKVAELTPDILLLDLNMPQQGGFEVARSLGEQGSACQVVVLSMYASSEFVETAKQVGCAGFVAKEDAGPDLIFALEHLADGFQMSSSVGRTEDGAVDLLSEVEDLGFATLTRTELSVLGHIAQSSTTQDIAEKMGVSPRTVDAHRHNIIRKLELTGSNSLVRYAAENRDKITGATGG